MKELALLLKVPIVVFKYDRSFNHYTIVDVAIYGSGGFNQHIVCLLHPDDNKFDWLELEEEYNRNVHLMYQRYRMYQRLYNSTFAEPSEYQRRIVNMGDEEDEQTSHHSFISGSGSSISGYSSSSGDDSDDGSPVAGAAAAAAASGCDAAAGAASAAAAVAF